MRRVSSRCLPVTRRCDTRYERPGAGSTTALAALRSSACHARRPQSLREDAPRHTTPATSPPRGCGVSGRGPRAGGLAGPPGGDGRWGCTALPPRSRRLSRGLRPRAPLLALLYPILSGMPRRRSIALCLAPGRVDGAAAPPGARGRSRGEGESLAGGGRKNAAKMSFEFPIRCAASGAVATPWDACCSLAQSLLA